MKWPMLAVVFAAALPIFSACSKKEPAASAPETAAPGEATIPPAPEEALPNTAAGKESQSESGGVASPFEKARERARLTQAMACGKQLYLAALAYAYDHGDRFPASLKDLVPDYLPDASAIRVKSPDLPAEDQWVFLTEGKTINSAADLPLFVLNGELNGKKVVVNVSGAALALPPDEARALIERQR
jgi:hypothetical protein